MTTSENNISSTDLWNAGGKMVRSTASILIACGVVLGFMWYGAEPRIKEYLDAREEPMRAQLSELSISVAKIAEALSISGSRPFIDFQGRGLVSAEGPFEPGQVVPVTYSLRRNRPCRTTIEIRFFNRKAQRIDTSLTSQVTATKSPVNADFLAFTVDVKVPKSTRPGVYSYRPLMIPEAGCGNAISVPFSDWFEVVSK